VAGLLAAGLTSSAASSPADDDAGTVVVASKNFEESRLLAEMFAQLLEARAGLTVERRLNLAGTQVCFEALRTGAVDLYPEYTGTGLVSLLGESPPTEATPSAGAAATLRRVRSEFLRRWDLHWLAPLGFENAYEVAVRRAVADERGLRTLSDLAAVSGDLRAAFGYEFSERDDGLPGLERTYGLRFASVQRMQQTIKYQAAGDGRVDALDVYTTDGRLLTYDLVVLEDDRGFFPPYQAAPLVRGAALAAHPQIGSVLSLLAGALDEQTMRGLNLRLQEGGEEPASVARDELARLGLVGAGDASADAAPARRGDGTFVAYLLARRGELGQRTAEHLGLTAAALVLGILTAVPAGLLLERRRRLAEPAIRVVGLTQTVPSLALLAFMIPLLGVGARPAVVALWIYSLFPMLRNTFTGVRDADPDAVAAALALGMTRRQVLLEIRLPLAAPVIMAGIRTAAVITVGTATLAAFIGAGGLGEPIVTGLQLADVRMILSGAVPAALLALAVDGLLAWVEHLLRPAGLES
jgi:osmoprotectant transport system permease protein